jgi:hypothetical protein
LVIICRAVAASLAVLLILRRAAIRSSAAARSGHRARARLWPARRTD